MHPQPNPLVTLRDLSGARTAAPRSTSSRPEVLRPSLAEQALYAVEVLLRQRFQVLCREPQAGRCAVKEAGQLGRRGRPTPAIDSSNPPSDEGKMASKSL